MPQHSAGPRSGTAFEPLFAPREPDDLAGHGHRQLIGALGLLLPLLLWLIAGWRPIDGLTPWRLLRSVSAYYYTGAVAAFVGLLVALGLVLWTYQGYDNANRRRDRIAAGVAGTAAIFVAAFPTAAPDPALALRWWTPATGAIHYAAAVILFGAFSYFALVLFPKTKVAAGTPLPSEKRVRNGIYVFCGVAIIAAMVWAGAASLAGAPIFWPEVMALEFFAVSWLVKGRADRTAAATARRVLYYGRHPGALAGEVRGALRR